MSVQGWIQEYDASRYLRKQSDDALKYRYDTLAGNLWSTDVAGNVMPQRHPLHREAILRLVVHVLCEQSKRTGDPSFALDETAIRQAASATYQRPKLTTPFIGLPSGYAKFGKREHIKRTFEEGVLRVAPASGFNDPSLNSAQRDDELLHWAVTPNQQLMMRLNGLDEHGNKVEIPVKKGELFRGMAVPDFYVWCCGFGYDARLFHEFQADAVIVIRDLDQFRSRFFAAMQTALPGWTMKDGPLTYYDPYNVRREELPPIFSKNLRYLHQNEYRFAWSSPLGEKTSKPLYPILGQLSDIAEYYEIDGSV
jgi:hypothetical protein